MRLFGRNRRKNQNEEILKIAQHRLLKYVTALNENGTQVVLGKGGRINVKDGVLYVTCEGKDVFSCDAETMEFGELLSHEGVRITGYDADGNKKSVVCNFH